MQFMNGEWPCSIEDNEYTFLFKISRQSFRFSTVCSAILVKLSGIVLLLILKQNYCDTTIKFIFGESMYLYKVERIF